MSWKLLQRYSDANTLWNIVVLCSIVGSMVVMAGAGVATAADDGSIKDCKGEKCEKAIEETIDNMASFFAETVLLKGGILALLVGAGMWAFSQKNANRAQSGKYMIVTAVAAIGLGGLWRSVAGLVQSWFYINPAGIT